MKTRIFIGDCVDARFIADKILKSVGCGDQLLLVNDMNMSCVLGVINALLGCPNVEVERRGYDVARNMSVVRLKNILVSWLYICVQDFGDVQRYDCNLTATSTVHLALSNTEIYDVVEVLRSLPSCDFGSLNFYVRSNCLGDRGRAMADALAQKAGGNVSFNYDFDYDFINHQSLHDGSVRGCTEICSTCDLNCDSDDGMKYVTHGIRLLTECVDEDYRNRLQCKVCDSLEPFMYGNCCATVTRNKTGLETRVFKECRRYAEHFVYGGCMEEKQ